MFRFELKKFLKRKSVIILLILYLLVTLFWFHALTEQTGELSYDDICESFIDFEITYMSWMVCLLAMLVSQIFAMEYRTNMMPVLFVSANGRRRLAMTKMKLAFLLANGFYMLFFWVVFVSYLRRFGFRFDLPIGGEYYIQASADHPMLHSMGDILFMNLAGAFVSINVTALICLYLSNRLKNALLTAILFIVGSNIIGFCFGFSGPLGALGALSPVCFFWIGPPAHLGVWLGNFYVSIYLVELFIYILVAAVLFFRLKKFRMVSEK